MVEEVNWKIHKVSAADISEWGNPRPNFKWPVSVEHLIAASPESVWEAISTPGNLERCHPFCAENSVEVWPGAGARDQIHYLSGWVYVRQFCRWIDGVGYDLEIGEQGGRKSFVSWRTKPHDDGGCSLRIAVYPHPFQEAPLLIRWAPHTFYIAPRLRSYLSSVLRGFEWYVVRGTPVPRNQFGTHPWFSAGAS